MGSMFSSTIETSNSGGVSAPRIARPKGGITARNPPMCLMKPKLQKDGGNAGATMRIRGRGSGATEVVGKVTFGLTAFRSVAGENEACGNHRQKGIRSRDQNPRLRPV